MPRYRFRGPALPPSSDPPTGLRRYGRVLRSPGVPRPAAGAALAALPVGMLGPAVLLLVVTRGDDLAAAGAVVAVLGVGTCTGMVVQGRLIDRFGARTVLLVSAATRVVASVAFVSAAVLRSPTGLLAALALAVGAGEPQVGGALRAAWPLLVEPALRPTAVALSTLLFEVPVLVGPLLLAGVLALWPAEVAVLVAAACAAAGTALFARAAPALPRRPAARAVRPAGPLAVPAVRMTVLVTAVQAFAIGLVQVTGIAAALAAGAPSSAAVVHAALTAGSLLGATACGTRMPAAAPRWHLPVLMAALGVPPAVAAAAPGLPVAVVCAGLFGLVAGPVGLRCFLDLERHTPPGSATTAVTTQIAAGLAATSAGSALAGRLCASGDLRAPLLVAALSCLLAAGLVRWRR
ncbi:hypothetical protein [Pseudonocardia humida]|uniref:MFS transporter n=1 Tax=Pseudonocardia humida TaxID=2800819 RepID=A0ABT1A5Z3_9PSEU|nr:hypothetical protein [Pseudonocardia humida]MCO1658438.1 hypothetical protein [Pseudonocardia humida]